MGREGRRLVVLDLSWIRGASASYRRLPPGALYLVPDGMVAELAGCDNPVAQASKFWELMRHNRASLVLGKNFDDIWREELSRGRPLSGSEIVSWASTRELHTCLADNPKEAWALAVQATALGRKFASHEEKRKRWVSDCALFKPQPDALEGRALKNAQEREQVLRRPDLFGEGYAHWFPQYSPSEWNDRILVFPDRFGIGRWIRIQAWSVFRRAAGETKGLENDWDDAQYALLASYAGSIVTRDAKLGRLMRAIFPSTLVHEHP